MEKAVPHPHIIGRIYEADDKSCVVIRFLDNRVTDKEWEDHEQTIINKNPPWLAVLNRQRDDGGHSLLGIARWQRKSSSDERPSHAPLLLRSAPFVRQRRRSGAEIDKDKKKPITLPGVEADGAVRLPNSWSIKPAGKQIELGDFPISIAMNSNIAAVLHAGYGDHEIIIVDTTAKNPRIRSRVVIDQTFGGLAFSPNGKHLFVGGGEFDVIHHFAVDGSLAPQPPQNQDRRRQIHPRRALYVHPDGKTLCVPGVFGHAVAIVELVDPKPIVRVDLTWQGQLSVRLRRRSQKRTDFCTLSLWNKASIAVIDLSSRRTVVQTIPTEKHPTEMAFGPDGKTLFVACSNSTRVSVIDLKDGKGLETINCALYANAPNGNTPNSLCLTPDGKILFVANADNNNLAVFNVEKPGDAKPLGFIPVGMYPTSVRYDAANKRILVANGRGVTVKANPKGPDPTLPKNPTVREYIASLYRGTLSIIDMPDEEQMAKYSKEAYACSPLRKDLTPVADQPKDKSYSRGPASIIAPAEARPAKHGLTHYLAGLDSKGYPDPVRLKAILASLNDPIAEFETLAKGKKTIELSEAARKFPRLAEFAKTNNIKDGKISREAVCALFRPRALDSACHEMPHQILHLRHSRKPHLRSGLRRHQGRQRRSESVHLSREGHAQRSPPGPPVCAARQLLLRRRGVGRGT